MRPRVATFASDILFPFSILNREPFSSPWGQKLLLTCTHTHTRTHMHTHRHTHKETQATTHAQTYTHTCVHTCVHMCTHMCTCTHTRTHTHTRSVHRNTVDLQSLRFQTRIACLSVTHTARSRGWRCEHVEELLGLRFSREKHRIAQLMMCSGIARLRDAVNMMRDFQA